MRQLVSSLFRPQTGYALLTSVILGLVIAGCHGSSAPVVPTSISIIPATSVSLKFGDVQELSAQVLDNNGNVMTNQKFVWTTSNSSIATVTATGGECGDTTNSTSTSCVCAGSWSSDFITCQNPPPTSPGGPPQSGTATITVTASGLSASISALVHAPVARVTITPTNVDCLSATGTQQLTPAAFDASGNNITNLVAVDSSSFSWTSSDSTVVSIDTKGLATAVNPGRARVYALIAGTSSSPSSFTTCPVVSLALSVGSGSGSTFSIAQAATQQLTATAIDSNGNTVTITSGRISYISSYPQALTTNSSGLVTATNPGNAAIVASCSPPSCNNGIYPIYSNVINGTTQGTTASGTNAKTTQVLAASLTDTQLVPIDITTNTVGTSLTLPYQPNSLVYSRAAATAYMGSSTELMSYDYASSTISAVTTIPGVIVNLSNGGNRIVLYDDATKTVTVYGFSAGVVDKFSVPNATPSTVHASTSPDEQTTYVLVGNQLFISNSTTSLKTITLNAPANDVAFLLQGSFAYLAGGENNAITARTTCDNSEKDVVAVTATPDRIIPSADGSKVYAVAGSVMNTVTATTTGAGCPPALTDSSASVDMGQGTLSTKQFFSNGAGTKLYIITTDGFIVAYDTAANTATKFALASGAPASSAALTQDGANLWVGGGATKIVHRVDTSSNTDAQQITIPVSADLIAVRNE